MKWERLADKPVDQDKKEQPGRYPHRNLNTIATKIVRANPISTGPALLPKNAINHGQEIDDGEQHAEGVLYGNEEKQTGAANDVALRKSEAEESEP